MVRNKTGITKAEVKILVYNKIRKGMSYDQAYKEVEKELSYFKKQKEERKSKLEKPIKLKKKFKEEFEKICKRKT